MPDNHVTEGQFVEYIQEAATQMNKIDDKINQVEKITGFNQKGNVATYADLATIENPQVNDAYGVIADGLTYVYNGNSFPTEGNGMDLRIKPDGVVEEGNTQAVSGGEVYDYVEDKFPSAPKSGTFLQAYEQSLQTDKYFSWWLEDEVDNIPVSKLIFHKGGQLFVDALGATVELDIDPTYFYNFKYTVKLTANNQQIYVPVAPQSSNYDMIVDWGDGVKTPFIGTGMLKSCSHIYTGVVGDEFQITISGNCPRLIFGNLSATERDTLLSIDNNTLEGTMLAMSLNESPNLEYICANAFQNFTTASPLALDFNGCTSLHTIEEGFGSYLSGKNVTAVSFQNTNISVLEDSFFQHILGLTNAGNMFKGTSLTSVPSSLRGALTNVTSIFYMFQGIDAPLNIPSDLFDLVAGAQITDFRNAFAGVSTNPSPITGDAKALYDVLVTKASGSTQTGNAFSFNAMINRNQVPTLWGGTL